MSGAGAEETPAASGNYPGLEEWYQGQMEQIEASQVAFEGLYFDNGHIREGSTLDPAVSRWAEQIEQRKSGLTALWSLVVENSQQPDQS